MGRLGIGRLVDRYAAVTFRQSTSLPLYRCKLVDNGSIARLWDRLAAGHGRFDPGLLGDLHLVQRFDRCAAKGRAVMQVRIIGDVAAVFAGVEDADAVVSHIGLQGFVVVVVALK